VSAKLSAKLSDGYGSEYVVLDAKDHKPVAGVVLLFPMSDKAALSALRHYLDTHREVLPALEKHWEQCANEWKRIDESRAGGAR